MTDLDGERAPRGARRGASRLDLAAIVAGAIALTAHALQLRARFGGAASDDAYISFRYAANAARGHGLVYNVGERVEGYSNFLWTALLAVVARASDDLTLPSQALGTACSIASLATVAYALRRVLGVAQPWAVAGLSLLVAASGYVASWAMLGLEGPLYGLLLAAAWARACVEAEPPPRAPLASALALALALTRPEGAFVALGGAALLTAVRVRRGDGWRAALRGPALLVAGLAAYHAWRFATYGPHLFPNSVRAKIGGGEGFYLRGATHVLQNFALPYGAFVAVCLVARGPTARAAHRVGLALVLGYVAFVVAVGGDWAPGRFYAPVIPLLAALTVASLASLGGAAARAAPAAVVALAALSWTVTSHQREREFRYIYARTDRERIAIGRWLRRVMPPDVLVGVTGAGAIPYYSGLRAHDMFGIVDPVISGRGPTATGERLAGHDRFDPRYTLEVVRPDVLVDPRYVPGMLQHPWLARDYVQLARWRICQVLVRRDLIERLRRQRRPAGP